MRINRIDSSQNFEARRNSMAEYVVNAAFDKLNKVRNKKSKSALYLGTTIKGDNVAIEETKFGKEATMFIKFATRPNKPVKAQGYYMTRNSDGDTFIVSVWDDKVVSKEAKKLKSIIDSLR